jgi:hypothetical protein
MNRPRRYTLRSKRELIGDREIPADWELWNAARPIAGDVAFAGPFLQGIFYTAIDPSGPYADDMRSRNIALDAALIFCVTAEQAVEAYRRYGASLGLGDKEFDATCKDYGTEEMALDFLQEVGPGNRREAFLLDVIGQTNR